MFMKNAKKKRQAEKLATAGEELLLACSHSPVDLNAVRSIIQKYPSSVKATNNKGDLSLHLACYNGASLEVVEYLVISYPDSIRIPDNQGSLALHWACFGTSPLIVIQNLLLQYPESIQQKTSNHQVPLHYACHGAGRLDVVKVLVEKWHDALTQQNVNGMLPLHIAVSSHVSNLQLVHYLVEQYPESVYTKSSTGEVAVDRARSCGAPQTVVDYLESINKSRGSVVTNVGAMSKRSGGTPQPRAAAVAASGKYFTCLVCIIRRRVNTKITLSHTHYFILLVPKESSIPPPTPRPNATIEAQLLHVCSEASVTVEQIQPLLQQNANAVMAKTQKGMRPLHICCWKGASVQVVEYLIQQWPSSVKARTARDWIPLHVACASDNSTVQLNVIQCLIQHWKDSVKAQDNKERIPLHIACFSRAPLKVVQYLVEQWPDSIMAMNNYASLPLHLACGTCADLNVIQFLVKSKPESLQAVDSEGRTPLDMARQPLQSDEPDAQTVAWLEQVLESFQEQKRKKEGVFDKERTRLMEVISGRKDKPVAVSAKYVETIISQQLGKGYFGVVFMGNDTVIQQKFAIKNINRKILVGGTKEDLERVKKEFKKEQKVRMGFGVVVLCF